MNSKKTRKALIGTFIGMMALTAASAATAGVAWFTTTRTATVQLPSAQIVSNRGELLVGKFATDPTARHFYDATSDYNNAKMDAISSVNGADFYNALLDVDGSELGKYEKDATPTIAEVGFSASTQDGADTKLGVYLDGMTVKLTDDYKEETLAGVTSQTAFVLGETAKKVHEVKVDDKVLVETTDYSFDAASNTLTFTVAPANAAVIEVKYQLEEAVEVADDPIKNSVRIALFSKNGATASGEAAVATEENLKLVWDTTHSTTPSAEVHRGVKAGEKDKLAYQESHFIANASQKWVDLENTPKDILKVTSSSAQKDLKEVFTAADAQAEFELANLPVSGEGIVVTAALDKVLVKGAEDDLAKWTLNPATKKITRAEALAEGDYVDIFYHFTEEVTYTADGAFTYAKTGRRVTLTNPNLGQGDVVKVDYRYDEIKDVTLANDDAKADLYYAGSDLKADTTDKDLSKYGAYLGSTDAGRLDVVVRAWIEGTDADHKVSGSGYYPTTLNSIDITYHNYELSMLVSLEAIDTSVA